MIINRPETSEYNPYYQGYITLVKHAYLIPALEEGSKNTAAFFEAIPADKLLFSYAPGKWTIQEVLGHLIDVERVFALRALWFARNDKAELPGFDEVFWTPESNANNRSINHLLNEYKLVRASTTALFSGFTDEMTRRTGTANANKISVRALGFIIPGHEIHHMGTIKERYL